MSGSHLPSVMPDHHTRPPRTVSVIDIGTNTVLLLIARVHSAGAVEPLAYEQRIPRLGQGVDAGRRLHPDSMRRAISALIEYRTMIDRFRPDRTAVIGTSAVRDAHNQAEFSSLVAQQTGFALEVLTGDDEAKWTYRGAISGIPGVRNATVVDIGGGSTEITTGSGESIRSSCSIDIGSVRLTERHLKSDPPGEDELLRMEQVIDQSLNAVRPSPDSRSTLVSVAGTATTIALLVRGHREFSLEAVSGVTLSGEEVENVAVSLSRMKVSEILALGSFMPGRADVITAGASILRAILRKYGFPGVTVSERGVRYGIALREWEKG